MDNKIKAVIYKIANKKDGKVYIGSSISFVNRWKCHRSLLRKGTHHSAHLQYAWNLYGESEFYIEIIDKCDAELRVEAEQMWLDRLRSFDQAFGYNMNPTAESCLGRKHTEETKQKISTAHKGKIRSQEHCRHLSEAQIGKTYSDEYKKNMSVALKGRIVSEETRKKISAIHTGLKRSIETRMRISIACVGRKISENARKKISEYKKGKKWSESMRAKMALVERKPLTTKQRENISLSRGGKRFIAIARDGRSMEFNTLYEAARNLLLDPSNIHKCLLGKAIQTKGYKFQYL